jgi:DNA-binding Xre family transcriptional regulator
MDDIMGVYAIKNRPTGRVYVGSSWRIHQRWGLHRDRLERGTHANRQLQADWSAVGADAFEFTVLERTDSGSLAAREAEWLSRFATRPGGVYNVRPVTPRCDRPAWERPPEPEREAIDPGMPLCLLRYRRAWSIRDLAAAAGVSTKTVQDVENGRVRPKFVTIRKLSEALGVEPGDVAEFGPPEAPPDDEGHDHG